MALVNLSIKIYQVVISEKIELERAKFSESRAIVGPWVLVVNFEIQRFSVVGWMKKSDRKQKCINKSQTAYSIEQNEPKYSISGAKFSSFRSLEINKQQKINRLHKSIYKELLEKDWQFCFSTPNKTYDYLIWNYWNYMKKVFRFFWVIFVKNTNNAILKHLYGRMS